jgi:hypothetical protein
MLMIAAGYEDGNDADALRRDPMFKLALDRLPDLWRKISPSRDLPLSRSLGGRRRPNTVQEADAIRRGSAQTSGPETDRPTMLQRSQWHCQGKSPARR